MSKKPRKEEPKRKRVGPEETSGPKATFIPIPAPLFVAGVFCLLASLLASGLLVFSHFAHLDLPGCGADSACADAQSSVFGKIPGLNWPISHIGFAWFIGLLAAWLGFRQQGVSPAFRTLARLSGLGSVAFLVIMVLNGYLCVYCVTAHLANLGFLACVECTWRRPQILEKDAGVALAMAGLATVLMVPVEINQSQDAADKARQEADASAAEVIAASGTDSKTFAGRYIKGPERAALRMVLFTDFQCKICNSVDEELKTILSGRSDIAVSVKHFPLSSSCNEFLAHFGRDIHPNACRAAQAVEAAGILKGDKAFYAMHDLIFEKYSGDFTDDQLRGDLEMMGYDAGKFFHTMNSEETARRIRNDINEGRSLGLHYTPMVFINGVQVKGVKRHGMLTRAVNRITAADPPALAWGEARDAPPDADAKIVQDWKDNPKIDMPPDHFRWSMGEQSDRDVLADVVLFGDYQEKNTRRADGIFRDRVEKQRGIRYTFRHCPFDEECNPNISRTIHPQACLAARAAEAAGREGGTNMFWQMHKWLWPNHQRFDMDNFKKVSRGLGLEPEAFADAMAAAEVEAALQEDVQASWDLKIRSIPAIYINGKHLPRWSLQGEEKLTAILDGILGAAAAPPTAAN